MSSCCWELSVYLSVPRLDEQSSQTRQARGLLGRCLPPARWLNQCRSQLHVMQQPGFCMQSIVLHPISGHQLVYLD